jgi:cytochrome c553
MLRGLAIAAGFAALMADVRNAAADDSRALAYGRHLSGECSACHRIDGIDNGIPSITGWPVDDFVVTLTYYREGARPNPAMVSVVSSLDDKQMYALAVYYGSLPKPARKVAPK